MVANTMLTYLLMVVENSTSYRAQEHIGQRVQPALFLQLDLMVFEGLRVSSGKCFETFYAPRLGLIAPFAGKQYKKNGPIREPALICEL